MALDADHDTEPGSRQRGADAKRPPHGPTAVRAYLTSFELPPSVAERGRHLAAAVGRRHAANLRLLAPVGRHAARLWQALERSAPVRFISASLSRRIFVSNLLGLATLIVGMVVLSTQHTWLIEAKRESLITQGEIIAAGISSNATVEKGRMALDPDQLPLIEGGKIPFRTDAFAANEFVIREEVVTPVLRRLMQSNNTVRARIYGKTGKLIVDSASLLQKGQIARSEPVAEDRPRAKTNWTRIFEKLFSPSNLPVYQEIGTADGTTYPEVRMALNSGTTTPMLLLTQDREQIVSIAAPIRRQGVVQGVLLLSTKPGEIDDILSAERKAIFTLALMALAATALATALLARTVAAPMRQLSDAAEHVSHNITARRELPEFPGRTDEVGQMATAFKAMTTALYRRIEASEKFAADVAHELKNPLTAARSTAESLTYARTDEQRNQLVKQISNEIQRLSGLITDVSNASRLDAELARQQTVPVDLSKVAETLVTTFRDILSDEPKNIELALTPSDKDMPFTVDGHEGRLAQVATNLIDNALSFSPASGTVTVRLQRLPTGVVQLSVEDEGPGIEEDKLETVFQRFYTYRPTAQSSRGRNSGLGLSITREIVMAHGGKIWAENRYTPGEGTAEKTGTRLGARFVVEIPAQKPAAAPTTRSLTGRGWRT
jgi:two-component system, OmpR family, sensor histidine kinase ChvG